MKKIFENYIKMILCCIPAGVLIGILCYIFTIGLRLFNSIRNNYFYLTIPFLCIVGLFIVYLFDEFDDKNISIKKGMKVVFDCGHNLIKKIPINIIPIVSVSTWLTNLCGGSCGREGVAVQIGATISKSFDKFKNIKNSNEIFVIAGMGAGFGAMFQTPISAILFAVEVLYIRHIEYFAIIPTIVETFVAYSTANFLSLNRESHVVNNINFYNVEGSINYVLIIKVIIASILFGVLGMLFSICMENAKHLYNKYSKKVVENILKILYKNNQNDRLFVCLNNKSKYISIFFCGIILSFLFLIFHQGRYSGTGTNLINFCFEKENNIFIYDFILKMILTIFTLSVGFQGGEVTPIFTIGATFGFVLSKFFNIDSGFLSSLGFISLFASCSNTLLCPIALGIELFGFNNIPFYIISVLFSYIFNFDKSIYEQYKK